MMMVGVVGHGAGFGGGSKSGMRVSGGERSIERCAGGNLRKREEGDEASSSSSTCCLFVSP